MQAPDLKWVRLWSQNLKGDLNIHLDPRLSRQADLCLPLFNEILFSLCSFWWDWMFCRVISDPTPLPLQAQGCDPPPTPPLSSATEIKAWSLTSCWLHCLLLPWILLPVARTQGFLYFWQTHPCILKVVGFLKYIWASTLGVCGRLSGCIVWQIVWNKTLWTSEKETLGGCTVPALPQTALHLRPQAPDSRSIMVPEGDNWQHPEGKDLFTNIYKTPLQLPRNIWYGTEGSVSPAGSKTSEISAFHVTLMITIHVHRLGTPGNLK